MTVPTYSRIDDTEIDPESALTTTLFHKLRDNCLALLGADGASSSPSITTPGQNLYWKFTSGSFSITIPAGCGSIQFELWGMANPAVTLYDVDTGTYETGYSGEYRTGTLAVTPAESLTIILPSSYTNSSFIKRGSTVLVEAKNHSGGSGGDAVNGYFVRADLNTCTYSGASAFGSSPTGPGGTLGGYGGVRIRY